MTQFKELLNPSKLYPEISKEYEDKIIDKFNEMTKESKVDVQGNKKTCEKLYETQAKLEKTQKKVSNSKGLKGLCIFLSVAFYIAMVVGVVLLCLHSSLWLSIGLLVGGALLGTGFVLITCLVLNKSITKNKKIAQQLTEEEKKLQDEAWKQMDPLNKLYGWNIPQRTITELIPLIQLDPIFEPKRLSELHSKYGFSENDDNTSTITVQSGSILGNPFVIQQNFFTEMGMETYVGTLVISWTTTGRDSNGNLTTQHHTQTLTATLEKPKPFYYKETFLTYGNDAAPDLSFSRTPSKANSLNEKQLAKFIKKNDKKLQKLTKKGEIQKMVNSDFDALFNAQDRDNEVQFRLLFTPLAQQSMVELIKSKEPYGDDFSFIKKNCLNFISTNHSQSFDYSSNPTLFYNYDYDKAKEFFIDYSCKYLESIYFDLAPLMSIPLYQQYKSKEYIYKHDYAGNSTSFEIESLLNRYDIAKFAHPKTVTDTILKCKFNGKIGANKDNITVDAYSYEGIPRIEHVPVFGGDGHTHMVPVKWIEYKPLLKSTQMEISKDMLKA